MPHFPRIVIHTVFPRWRRIAAILLLSFLACGTALLGQAGFDDVSSGNGAATSDDIGRGAGVPAEGPAAPEPGASEEGSHEG